MACIIIILTPAFIELLLLLFWADLMTSIALADESVLLKHECAYCLGQMQDKHAIPVLVEYVLHRLQVVVVVLFATNILRTLKDEGQDVMVRHEVARRCVCCPCSL